MDTMWSWVQPLHSILASSDLRDMYEVYNRGEKFGYQTQDVGLAVLTTYH